MKRALAAAAISSLLISTTHANLYDFFGNADTEEVIDSHELAFAEPTAPTASSTELNYAKLLSNAFTSVAERAIPAVVYIHTETVPESHQIYASTDPFSSDFFSHFFGMSPNMRERAPFQSPPTQKGKGSGFIISPDGHIMTNYHVVKNATTILVHLNDKEQTQVAATLVGGDPQTDVAILKIEGEEPLPYLEFENIKNIKVGEWAIAIGNPFDLEASVTVGVVSAKGRNDLQINDLEDFLQTDAATYPGNSGGPLLNIEGRVMGMNTAILTNRGGFTGISFAVPSSILEVAEEQIVHQGVITRGYIGVLLQDVTPGMEQALSLDRAQGAIITQVLADAPADEAGLKQGDVILELNGKTTKDRDMVRSAIAILPQGSTATLTISRLGKIMNIAVPIGKNDSQQVASSPIAQKLGITVTNLDSELAAQYGYKANDEGVLVTDVRQGSVSGLAQMRPGMLIKNVNHQPVANVEDFNQALEDSDEKGVFILANDRGRHMFISLMTN